MQPTPVDAPRGRLRIEVVIVLALSLGASAAYSIVSLLDKLTRTTTLAQQSTTLNAALNDRAAFDLTYQLMGIFFALAPVALVCWLLWRPESPRLGRLGIDGRHPLQDLALGGVLALVVGLPGIGVYLGARALGLSATVIPTSLDAYWWTVPVLILSAARAGITEEVIVIGYLFARLRDLGWNRWAIIASTALLRGTYHLYQGFGGFVGNVAMGLLFGWLYTRTGRVLPLVIAHTVIDAAIFVGYPWAASTFPGILGA